MHFHVLPGIDDGPGTMDESVALAHAAALAGVRTLVATPHVNWTYRNDAERIAVLVGELSERLTAEGVVLELRAGAELAMSYLSELSDEQLSHLSLGGGEWLLVEPPFTQASSALAEIVRGVRRRGYGVLLAHPERCPAFQRSPRMLGEMVADGVLTSITAGSLVGRFGSTPRRFARRMLHEQLVHNVASDAHDVAGRAPGIAAELEQVGAGELREWLTQAVPEAILDGGQVPAQPQPKRAGTRRRLLRRAW
ncbi:MAG TPA: CpsB/CapC family capsule biosynthesis tyrosine phosphatase [Solirubrobacteraceae bacterium]|nr:CpsB/CapC family capsule biosynthesis tyrosine phosphatase [Solirubrobacteraceae bacterium]